MHHFPEPAGDRRATDRRQFLQAAGALGLGAALWPGLAAAQPAWPTKSLRFVVPFAPGG
ncbi:twin-arginine translocation signal domain-containing protein, partial [Corallococcus sp. AB049A]|uniref:twin-arginine translocation signal domain-containing protein n=1 Tax=Corallococcus sp. AB049A TaxID=2316721 RepID=UPI000EC30B5B